MLKINIKPLMSTCELKFNIQIFHAFVKKADTEVAIARQNIVEVMVEN